METASGQRVYEEAGRAFEAESTRLQIRQDVIASALSLYIGARVAARIARAPRRPPPSFQTYPKDSVWSKPPAPRGVEIERRLGGNLPPNFETMDRWHKGVATSIKSIDMRAATYQKAGPLQNKVKGYIDGVARFRGATLKNIDIQPELIKGRRLVLAISAPSTAVQQKILRDMVAYGKSVGVEVSIVVIP